MKAIALVLRGLPETCHASSLQLEHSMISNSQETKFEVSSISFDCSMMYRRITEIPWSTLLLELNELQSLQPLLLSL